MQGRAAASVFWTSDFKSVQTPEQIKASYDQHHSHFDYLLGDWELLMTIKSLERVGGFWSAVRLAEGAQVLDEFRIVSPSGDETFYASSTLRAYNAVRPPFIYARSMAKPPHRCRHFFEQRLRWGGVYI